MVARPGPSRCPRRLPWEATASEAMWELELNSRQAPHWGERSAVSLLKLSVIFAQDHTARAQWRLRPPESWLPVVSSPRGQGGRPTPREEAYTASNQIGGFQALSRALLTSKG